MDKCQISPIFMLGQSGYSIDHDKAHSLSGSIDRIYHSTTWEEMCLKIGLERLEIDTDVFMMLCATLCYHYGFWPHTRPRYYAFKKLLNIKRANPLSKVKMMRKTYNAVYKEVVAIETNLVLDPSARVPGSYDEQRAWKSILHALHKLQFGKDAKRR